jgi:soluble cytochrome b562
MQFLEAKEQRESASQALENARQASAKAEEASSTAEQARDETRKTVEQFRTNIKLLMEMEHLTDKLVTSQSNIEEQKKVIKKLEEFAVPNEKERRDWLETLGKKRGEALTMIPPNLQMLPAWLYLTKQSRQRGSLSEL